MRKAAWTFYGIIALTALLFGLLWLKHSAWLGNANSWLLGGPGDGLKNNFTALWHIRRDANSVHYTGMNAPWGDHVIFTDGQPLFANGIRWLGQRFDFIKNRDLGWLNWLIVLGQLLGAAFIYMIFRRLHLPVWFAVLASTGLILVAPQNAELTAGHFSLANIWVIPLVILLLIQYEERPYRRPWSILMATTLVGSAMLHPYFFVLAAVFLTLYQFFQVAKRPSWRHFKKRLAHWVVMVLLPFGIVHFWLNLGHSVLDRPEFPEGFVEMHASPAGVFLPPTGSAFAQNGAYLGLLVVIFTAWLIVRRFLFFEKSWDTEAFHRRQKRFLSGTTFAGLVMLVFALGFPYSWPGGGFMADWMGPLRQFRGTAKFAWPWFFIGNILFFYVLWQTARRWKETWLQILTVSLTFSILFLEAWMVQKMVDLQPRDNFFLKKEKAAPWLLPIDFTKMQAILPLPFYREGAENFELPADTFLFEKTQLTALETGLPDLGSRLARTSLSQTFESFQLVGEPFEVPAILDQLPTDQPLAIFLKGKKMDKNQPGTRRKYAHLLEKSRPIWRSDSLEIFSLPLDSLVAAIASHRQKIERESKSLVQKTTINGWKSTSSAPAGFFSASWDLNPAAQFFQGRGAFVASFSDKTELFKMPMPAGKFTFSIWQFVADDRAWTAEILAKEIAPDGAEVARRVVNLRCKTVGIAGSWAFYEFEFDVKSSGNLVSFEVLPKKGSRQPLFFDEMMVRPMGPDFFKVTEGWVAKNNYWYRK